MATNTQCDRRTCEGAPAHRIHCSVCGRPGVTRARCNHCWDQHLCLTPGHECTRFGFCWAGRRCQRLACERCRGLGINYGRVVDLITFSCGTTLCTYENGSVIVNVHVRAEEYDTWSDYGDDVPPIFCGQCSQYHDAD